MRATITHEFIETVPDRLDDGIIYISLTYATAVHRCCCGCGHEVVTPLHPKQWSVTFNGETVSLSPSIGNWSFACRSHYWVREGQIRPARIFGTAEVARLRAEDELLLDRHFNRSEGEKPDDRVEAGAGWWRTIAARFRCPRS
ncbi:DUF6527 family protein [Amycolatopsis sp. La24]|uniref:DUF6527 family protein n=1 Tax=Amycolatopsis sp. La24 TaxID=3028304 RepID=UPI0023B09986|nr:DUF6527 family protein [Amycolatopsis sp. La24]